jgi:hypothetical protein
MVADLRSVAERRGRIVEGLSNKIQKNKRGLNHPRETTEPE